MKKLFFLFFVYFTIIGCIATCLSQELPIKPARTISFTTDEGSNMNVDLSPDGKTLVFDLLGDLYTVPATGGDATQLTRGIALHVRPVWSPDGKRLAYISDNSGAFHLHVMDLSGTFHTVLGQSDGPLNYGWDAVWTPDGRYIAVGDSVYGLATGKLTAGLALSRPIRFSPDGQFIYGLDSGKQHLDELDSIQNQWRYSLGLDSASLYCYDKSTRNKKAIVTDLRKFYSAALSPDGRWWCYITDSNGKRCLIAQNLLSGESRMLVPALTLTDPRYNHNGPSPHFSFTPDSREVFIGYGGKIHRIDIESGTDQIIPFKASVFSDLGPYNYNTFRITHDSVRVKYTRFANASRDGKHLVFSALDRIYVMDLPNGRPHVLAPQPVGQLQPVYSPDGKWIGYVSWCDTVGGFLWRVRAEGGEPEQLTHVPANYQRLAWSPDGTLLAVVAANPLETYPQIDETGRLELISINGGPQKTIDDSVPLINQVDFSPDGRRLIYTPKFRWNKSDPQLPPSLVSKDTSGNDQRVLAVGGYNTYYQEKAMSADGRYLAYSMEGLIYLVPICKLTEPFVIDEISDDKNREFSAIRFASGVDPYWEKCGKVLAWSYGNRFYRIDPDKVVTAAEKMTRENAGSASSEDGAVTVEVKPDETIAMDVRVPSLYAHGVIALKDVRIITMQDNKVIGHGTIVIKDGRITAVGPVDEVRVPKEAKLLYLPGTTIMPGLVDLHLHMTISPSISPQQSWRHLANLAYGVTTARDPSSSFESFGHGEQLETGQMTGPRLYTVGNAVRLSDGVIRFAGIEDARDVVGQRAELGGICIKQYMLPSRLQRQWLAIACREAGLNMTNEGTTREGENDPLIQIGMIKDGSTGIEHNPQWGDVYKDEVSFYALSGICLTPTLQVAYGTEGALKYFDFKYWHQPDARLALFRPGVGGGSLEQMLNWRSSDTVHPDFIAPAVIDARIRKEGGRVALGCHGNDEGNGPHNELWALQMGGLSNMQALQAGTIMGAEALGLQRDIGSIEVGKIADLIILNRNPLEDIHNSREIRYVMKDGILYDGNTLDELWPIVKKCPEWKMRENGSSVNR